MLALALIVIPVVIRTTENMLALIPNALREAAYALGAPKWKVIMTVTLKAARAGVITGILLAVARIAGETAPLLFTALSNQFWTSDLSQPMASLPVTIFKFAMSPYENWQKLAWAGVFLITLGVLVLNILARILFRNKHLTETPAWTPKSNCPSTEKPKLAVRNLNFYYGKFHALKNINLDIPEKQGHGLHRPVGLRQVDPAAHLQPHVRALSRAARRGRDHARRREHADLARTTSR